MRDKRRYGLLPLLVLMAALFSGCAAEAAQQQGGSFRAVVLELLDDGVVVEPLDGEVRETYPAGVDAVSWEITERAVALG